MKRIESLDSLRGLAAFAVMLNHCALVYSSRLNPYPPPWSNGGWRIPWSWIDYTPLKLLFAGDQAVLVFFALSGFVLALTLKKLDDWKYSSYITKRLCRIYLPFAFCIFLSAGLYIIAKPTMVAGLSKWFNYTTWRYPVDGWLLFGHLAMTDAPRLRELDDVMWSLVQELRISIIFPIIAFCASPKPVATLAVCTVISAVSLLCHHVIHRQLMFDPFITFQYIYLFAAGAVLALHAHEVRHLFSIMPPPLKAVLWLATLVLVTYPANKNFGLFVCGAASIALVALCFADEKVDRHLSSPAPIWLGRISYSLYLLHVPILAFVLHTLNGRSPLIGLIAASICLSLVAAELTYRFVERPAILLGRRLASQPLNLSSLRKLGKRRLSPSFPQQGSSP